LLLIELQGRSFGKVIHVSAHEKTYSFEASCAPTVSIHIDSGHR
jgi:hypothetical protein